MRTDYRQAFEVNRNPFATGAGLTVDSYNNPFAIIPSFVAGNTSDFDRTLELIGKGSASWVRVKAGKEPIRHSYDY
jgi:hypothetical protein